MNFTISLTLHLWWLWAYLAAGLVLFIPLGWALNRQVTPRQPLTKIARRYWRRIPIWIAAWPVSVWALAEWRIAAWRRSRQETFRH